MAGCHLAHISRGYRNKGSTKGCRKNCQKLSSIEDDFGNKKYIFR